MAAPRAKLSALETAARCLEAGEPVPPDVAGWLADGFRRYIRTEGEDLDDALLLKPRQGKPSPWSEARRERISELLAALSNYFGGGYRSAGIIVDIMTGRGDTPPGEPEIWLMELAALNAPASIGQIWRLISDFHKTH